MFYKDSKSTLQKEGVWDEKSCVRRIGGYDIDKTSLPEGATHLLKGTVMAYDASTGKVKLVHTAKVYEKANQSAVSIKVEKGGSLKVGDTINGKAVSVIDTSNTNFDVITIEAIDEAIEKGTVIADANAPKAIGLTYASVKLDDMPSCSVTLQAYEIQEDTLPYPVNDIIKEALTARHAFKV